MNIEYVEIYVEDSATPDVVEIGLAGAQGPPGERGLPGVDGADGQTGPPGIGSSTTYPFPTATTQWTINHNLGHDPSVTVISGPDQVSADVTHSANHNTSYVNFGMPTSGSAIIS